MTSLPGASAGELRRRGGIGEKRASKGEGEPLELGGGRGERAREGGGGRGEGVVLRRGQVAAERRLARKRRARVREGVLVRRRRQKLRHGSEMKARGPILAGKGVDGSL